MDKKLARNYAAALYCVAMKHDLMLEILEQLQAINHAIDIDPKIKRYFYSPILSRIRVAKIIEIIAQMFKLHKITRYFLLELVKNSRIALLSEIIELSGKLLDKQNHLVRVSVIYANELNAYAKQQLKDYLTNKLETAVELIFTQDPSIIGGIIINYDNVLEDYSIKNSLKMIREHFMGVMLDRILSEGGQ